MRIEFSMLIAFITLPVSPNLVCARGIPNWSYEKLFQQSDVVIIAEAKQTIDCKDRRKPKTGAEFIGQETTFTIKNALKGKVKANTTIKVLHFRLPKGVLVSDGPLTVRFRSKPLAIQGKINNKVFKAGIGIPHYMLFLKKRPDGRFEPVSGFYDPALSVREMNMPGHFFDRFREP